MFYCCFEVKIINQSIKYNKNNNNNNYKITLKE